MDEDELNRRTRITIEELDGIQPQHFELYRLSLLYSASQSRGSFIHYADLIKFKSDPESIFASLQEALTHAAGLSKFLWPVAKKKTIKKLAEARAENLRRRLSVHENDPLANSTLRNAMEHYDEHLDQFLLKHDAGYFFPTPLIKDYRLASEPTGKIFKLADPKNGKCILLGEEYDYVKIWESVETLCAKLTK